MPVLSLLILALLDAGGHAGDTYAAVVDRYARCDAEAVNDLLDLGSGSSAIALLPDSMLPIALVLHTEAAFASPDPGIAATHLERAQRLGRSVMYRPETLALRRHAHLVASAFHFGIGDLGQIQASVATARSVMQPEEAQLLSGSLDELIASDRLTEADRQQVGSLSSSTGNTLIAVDLQRRSRRFGAERAFQDVVRMNPRNYEAHVRLANIQVDLGKTPEAVSHLALAASAREPTLQYWTALFAARVSLRRKDVAAAEASYRTALAALPAAQTAHVGLAHLLRTTGRASEASALIDRMLHDPRAAAAADDDPWWDYYSGPFWRRHALIREMRDMVRTCR